MALVLFDIDSTLIDTSRSGMLAMEDAGRELYGPAFASDGVDYAGRLDPLIVHDLLVRAGVEPTERAHAEFRACYRVHLGRRLSAPGVGRTLPGIDALLAELRGMGRPSIGVLTGNYRETGSLKLEACGIDPAWFEVQVWGDDSPHRPARREHLPPVGMKRFEACFGRAISGADVTIVGDTVHDVSCAKENGCRVLGVATGKYGTDALEAAGADLVLKDLSETARVLDFLTRTR